MKFFIRFLTLTLLFIMNQSYAQEKMPVKFGQVTPKDLAVKKYEIDTSAHAVIIAESGYTSFEANNKMGFTLNFKCYRRVHILDKKAFDLADFNFLLYKKGETEESLEDIRAVTYNLVDGKVVASELDLKNSVYKEIINKEQYRKKFTFPNVREGSVIEIAFTIKSDFLYNLQPWNFQDEYPCLWSEYKLSLPSFYSYLVLTKGYLPFAIQDKKDRSESFTVINSRGMLASDRYYISANVTDFRWVMKNVPAFKEEKFTSSSRNHISRIEFQLKEALHPLEYRNYTATWHQVIEDLLKRENFGEKLTADNFWMDEITKPLFAEADKPGSAKRIFYYVRDNFTCTDYSELFAGQSLREVYKTKKGAVSEINLLLVALLKHVGLEATPVILSTREHGVTNESYPLLSQYNYVIVQVVIDGHPYYLDATEIRLAFGRLPLRCYNGHARLVNTMGAPLYFNSDTLTDRRITSVIIINDKKGNLAGSLSRQTGDIGSFYLREAVPGKGLKNMQEEVAKLFSEDVVISNFAIDSINNHESNILLHYDFDYPEQKADRLYFNPLIGGEEIKENPFKSANRLYPVEMPYGSDYIYTLQMEVPAGFEVEELPKSVVVRLNDSGDAVFEYNISYAGNSISFRSRLIFRRANFVPQEYEMLRGFYAMIVKKESEQIVFKRKKSGK